MSVPVAIEFDTCEESQMADGNYSFIFYLTIRNLHQKMLKARPRLATYVTAEGEQVEQDIWLRGTLTGQGGRIRGGVLRRVGMVFYKQNLRKVSPADSLYFALELPDIAVLTTAHFSCCSASPVTFDLAGVEEEPLLDVAAIAKHLKRSIERLELIEDRVGVTLSGLFVRVSVTEAWEDVNYSVIISGEARLESGTPPGRFQIKSTVYGDEGVVLGIGSTTIDFTGAMIPVVSFEAHCSWFPSVPVRVRIYPERDDV